MRTGRETDMTKLTVAFRKFANAPKKEKLLLRHTHNLLFPRLASLTQRLYGSTQLDLLTCSL
jgi:hypothetical protein